MQNTRFINPPACAFALLLALASQNAHADAGITPAEARAIAKEAYIYANPVVDSYLYGMAAAVLGIWGNSEEEAIYPAYYVDADGEKLDGSHRYTLRFAPDQLPPVETFWSLTMYELPASLLTDNPLDRYLLNSPMLEDFVRDDLGRNSLNQSSAKPNEDGSYTIRFGGDPEGINYLPITEGWNYVVRMYQPRKEILDGEWTFPTIEPVK